MSLNRIVLYPFLFAIYPILVLYFSNEHILPLHIVLTTILLVILIIAILLALSSVTLKSLAKGGLVVSLLWVWFFCFKSFNEGIIELFKSLLYIHFRGRYSALIWTLLFVLGITLLIRKKSSFQRTTTILNVTSMALILFSFSMNIPGSPLRYLP